MKSKRRCFFIGLDGADWKLLDLLFDKGLMPNLAKLKSRYDSGVLNSTIPPLTAPAWSSFLTGVNPGEHGIYFWQEKWDKSKESRRLLTNSDIKVPQLAEILNGIGKSVGLLNCPFTYPVKKVNGYMVSGMLSPGLDKRSVYPESLVSELKSLNYIANIGVTSKEQGLAKLDKLVDGLVSMTKKRTETFLYLEKKFKTDFAGLVYVSIDRIQHLVYGLVEDYLLEKDLNKEEEKIARKALKIYEAVDDGIGEIVELVREDDLLLVASDHGFRKANRWVNLNQVFVDEGLVKVDSKSVIISRVYGLLKKLGIDSFVRDKGLRLIYLIRNFRKKTDKSNFAKSVEESQSIKSSIDYNRSKLVVGESGEQGVYLLDISVKNKVKKILEGLVDEDLGIKPIRGVYLKEDLYSGKALDRAPDILIDMAEPYQIKSSKLMAGPIFEDNSWRYGGYHRQEGIYIISRSFIDRQNSKRNSIWQLLAKVIDNFK